MGFLVWATIGVGMYQISNSSENTTDGFLAAKAKSFITPILNHKTEDGHKTYWVPSFAGDRLIDTNDYWKEKFDEKAMLFNIWTWIPGSGSGFPFIFYQRNIP